MKQVYQSPDLEYIRFGLEDVLRTSDNDVEFIPPVDSDDSGWSGYY